MLQVLSLINLHPVDVLVLLQARDILSHVDNVEVAELHELIVDVRVVQVEHQVTDEARWDHQVQLYDLGCVEVHESVVAVVERRPAQVRDGTEILDIQNKIVP